jgi:hypothetical protein
MQRIKVKGWRKADVTSAAIAAYLNNRLESDVKRLSPFHTAQAERYERTKKDFRSGLYYLI